MATEPATTNSPARRVSDWQWSVILYIIMIVYLGCGAVIFHFTESKNSLEAQKKFRRDLHRFSARPSCVRDPTDGIHLRNNLSLFLWKGASLKARYWLQEEEDVTSTWDVISASVLTLTIVTTIGYGDIVPRTTGGKLFCMFYAVVGLPLVGYTLSVFAKSLKGFIKRYKRGIALLERPIPARKPRMAVQSIITASFVLSLLIVIPGWLLSFYEHWSFFEGVYFLFITVSTIGFGDLSLEVCPECHHHFWLILLQFVVYVFVGISVITALFRAFTDYQKEKVLKAESAIYTLITSSRFVITSPEKLEQEREELGKDEDSPVVEKVQVNFLRLPGMGVLDDRQ